jgi:hypothetical protein
VIRFDLRDRMVFGILIGLGLGWVWAKISDWRNGRRADRYIETMNRKYPVRKPGAVKPSKPREGDDR